MTTHEADELCIALKIAYVIVLSFGHMTPLMSKASIDYLGVIRVGKQKLTVVLRKDNNISSPSLFSFAALST